ncbi:MAG: DsbA family oxidoreductase [Dechloromonas sp.]|uniref:DsbA family oxidoreductase n=1 Tax=Candidatus Dechloromonas phosphorivorans TaxID=2899244 RepID=A0A935K753_9RHOO|nr:DsbA family oxidoreductase [Candidatus Dechloromonas phosphorivorans]
MITIDIVSDIVCPWCFIGKRRLATAIELVEQERPNFSYQIHWLPFFLNPDTPPEGELYLPFLEKKFGSRERVDALFENVRAAGRPYGIEYAFEKIAFRANTLKAHRLLYWAQQRGPVDQLVERLSSPSFNLANTLAIWKRWSISQRSAACQPKKPRAYLASDQNQDTVRQLEREYRQRGINSVPSFILQNSELIVGAEDPKVAEGILQHMQKS